MLSMHALYYVIVLDAPGIVRKSHVLACGVFKGVLSCTKYSLSFFDVVLEACVNPVETLLATDISRSKYGRVDRGNGHVLWGLTRI